MAFPSNPQNGAQYTSGGYVYQYVSATNLWKKISSTSSTTANASITTANITSSTTNTAVINNATVTTSNTNTATINNATVSTANVANLSVTGSAEFYSIVLTGGISANGSYGTPGYVLKTDGSKSYWASVTSGGGVDAGAQYTWTNTQTFSNTITFSSTINGTANNALYLGGTAASGYQTTAGLSANVATLTANNSGYLNGKLEADLNVNNALTSNSAAYLGSTAASGYQTTAGLSANVAKLTANAAGYLNGKLEADLNVNSALTSNAATYLNGKTESNLNVNSAVSSNNSSYLGGTAAAGYQTTAGLSSNVATLTANAAGYLNGKLEADLNVNNALTANNSAYLGGIVSSSWALKTYVDNKAGNAYSNAVAAIAFSTANDSVYLGGTAASGYQTTAGLSANVATLTANASGYLNGKTESNLNVNNAVTVGGNTVTDLRTYSSNATNISSGTIAEARLPYRINQDVQTTSNVTFANVAMTSGTITTLPTSSTDIVNKQYADSIASGINFHPAVRLTTNADLGTATYNNGTSGVGATITKSTSFAALVIDTVTVAYQDRILVRAQSNSALNGVYSVSNTGSGSYAWVLTRAYDYDTVGVGTNEIDKGDLIYVLEGSIGAGTAWVQQSTITTVGTDAITFAQFSSKALYALTGGTGLYYSAGAAYDGSAATTLAVNSSYIATLSSNNASYLGGTAASGYQTTAGLSANVATLSSNNASYLGGTIASGYQTTAGLSANVATLTANNASYLGGTAAAGYQTTAGLSANVATLTANAAGYLNGKLESALSVSSALTSNNASYLGGTVASGYQTTAGLSANVATLTANAAGYLNGKLESALSVSSALTANNSSYLGGTAAAGYQTTAGLSANVATLTANAAGYLGTVAAASYVQNTDSRTLSGNINFTGTNTYFSGKATHNANLVLNAGISVIDSTGSQGTTGQVLTSNGTGNVYWSTVSGGGGSVNVAAQYTWTNTQTFSNTITFSSSILANTINAASYTVGTTFTANSTLVNAAAINITGQTNTATFYATTTANVGTLLRANTSAYLVAANSTVNTIITATSITQANTTATPFIANATGIYHTGAVNAASVSATNATFQGINLTSNASTLFSTYSTSFSTSSVNASWPTPTLPSAGNGYTVEFFVKFSSLGSTQVAYSDNGIAGLGFYANTSAIQIADQGYGNDTLSGLSLQNGVWYHIALIGRNSLQYIAVNGVVQQIGTGPGGHYSDGTWGGWGSLKGPATFSNFRIVTGSQVYSLSGFAVPSAPLTPISGTYVLTLQDATFIDNSGSSRSITTTGSPSMAADSISVGLTSASTVGTLNNGNLTIPVITPTYIYANSVVGTAGQVLTSNSAGGLYWATPAATNTSAQFSWSNTQTFSNTITFSTSILANTVNAASYNVGTSFIANTTGAYHTGTINAASYKTTGFVANTTAIVPTSNTILLGNTIGRFVLSANTGDFSGSVTATGLISTVTGTNTTEILRGNIADNDYFRILIGGTATNAGYAEIATADDGNEPIYVRQYSSTFAVGTIARTATLLDGSGNSIFPQNVNAASYTVGTNFIANTTGTYHSGTINAASHTVGTNFIANSTAIIGTGYANVTTSVNSALLTVGATFTANATLVNAAAINITGQVNTATLYATTSANVGTLVQANTTAYLVGSNTTVNTVITATSITQSNTTAVPLVANVTGIYHTGIINAAAFTTTGNANAAVHYAGANVYINATAAFVSSNSTVNTIITATSLTQTNTTATPFTANVTGLYHTGTMNAASHTVGTSFIANTSQITISGIPLSSNGGVGTAGQVLTSNGGTGAPYWSTVSAGSTNVAAQYSWTNTQTFSNVITFSSTTASPNATAGAIVTYGGIGANGNIYTAGRIGFANSAGANQAYTYYNASTTSLDTVFG